MQTLVSKFMQHFINSSLAILLVVALFLQPISFETAEPQVADAAWATEFTQVKNTLENTFSTIFSNINMNANLSNLGIQFSLLNKEFTLDGIAFFIAKAALQSITGSLLEWINNGFQGSPAFVQNLEQHLMTIADQELARLVFSPEALDFICSPFELDVQAAVATSFQERMSDRADYRGPQCSLSDIQANVENFLAGDFIGGGGMDTFFRMTQNPSENTALGAYLAVEAEVAANITNAEGQEVNLLNFGDGFLSFKSCDGSGACSIQTPGKVISEALTFQLSTGAQTLIEADEINEIVGALFYALMNQVIQGAGGLLGLDNSSGGYVDTLRSGQAYSRDSVRQVDVSDVDFYQNVRRGDFDVTVEPAPDTGPPTVQLDQATIDAIIGGINSGGGGGFTPTPEPVSADPVAPGGFPPSIDP